MIELFNIDFLSYTAQAAETAPQHSYTIYWLILLAGSLTKRMKTDCPETE